MQNFKTSLFALPCPNPTQESSSLPNFLFICEPYSFSLISLKFQNSATKLPHHSLDINNRLISYSQNSLWNSLFLCLLWYLSLILSVCFLLCFLISLLSSQILCARSHHIPVLGLLWCLSSFILALIISSMQLSQIYIFNLEFLGMDLYI